MCMHQTRTHQLSFMSSVRLSKEHRTTPSFAGDLNLTLNANMDACNYKHLNNPQSRRVLINTMNNGDLIDFFRAIHPKTKHYTWRRQNPIKQARLDYFIGSRTLLDLITKCNISAGYRSDHSSIELILKLSEFKRGKGIWKFNCSLLKDKEYLDLINKTIKDETVKYAAKIYNMEKIDQISFENIHLTIGDRLFLETLLLEMRGTTIQYSTQLKKEQTNEEQKLIGEIEQLESQENDNLTALTEKKRKIGISP